MSTFTGAVQCNTSCLLLLFYNSQQVYTNYGIVSIAFLGPGRVSWAKIACMIGGGNGPETVRKRVIRELRRDAGP